MEYSPMNACFQVWSHSICHSSDQFGDGGSRVEVLRLPAIMQAYLLFGESWEDWWLELHTHYKKMIDNRLLTNNDKRA